MKKSIIVFALCFIAINVKAGTFSKDYTVDLNNYYGYTNYAKQYKSYHKQNNFNSSLNVYSKISYEISETTYSIIGYLMADTAKNVENYNQGKWGEEIFGLIESSYGDISVGQNNNVAYGFAVGAPSVGNLRVNNTEIVNFITNPNWYKKKHDTSYKTLNSTYLNTDGVAPKVNYITPDFSGIKLGLSYIPKTYNQTGLVAKSAPYKNKSAYVLGAYGAWDILGSELETSLGFGEYDSNDREYSLGVSLYRKGWTFGGSYRKTNTTSHDYAINKDNLYDAYRKGQAYNLGISYEIGPLTTGVSYFDSKSTKFANHDKIISFSNSYQYNKNTAFSITISHLKSKGENQNIENNTKGYAFIFGLELSL